jgi:hypothetical protein
MGGYEGKGRWVVLTRDWFGIEVSKTFTQFVLLRLPVRNLGEKGVRRKEPSLRVLKRLDHPRQQAY